MKYKELLIKLGEQTEEKINLVREYQKQIADIMKDRTHEELEELRNDPELKELGKKLEKLLEEIWQSRKIFVYLGAWKIKKNIIHCKNKR